MEPVGQMVPLVAQRYYSHGARPQNWHTGPPHRRATLPVEGAGRGKTRRRAARATPLREKGAREPLRSADAQSSRYPRGKGARRRPSRLELGALRGAGPSAASRPPSPELVCKNFPARTPITYTDALGPGNPGVAATSVPIRGREDRVLASKLQDLPPY